MGGPNTNLRAAVVGVGYLGAFHAQKYHQLPDVELVGVVDTDRARAERVASELGTRAYTDHRPLLDRVDLVSIVTPTGHHCAIARDFLHAGVAALVEKPIAEDLDQARALVELAAERDVLLQVGHVERFNPAVRAALDQCHRPNFIESHRLAAYNPRGADVDVVLDLMIHDIDILLGLVPSAPVAVQGVGVSVLTDSIDIANARVEFASGCIANVTASRISNKAMRKFRVFAHNTYLSIDCLERRLSVHRKGAASEAEGDGVPIEVEERCFEKGDALLDEIQAFVHSFRTGAPPAVSGVDGVRALQVALEVTEAIKHSPQRRLLEPSAGFSGSATTERASR